MDATPVNLPGGETLGQALSEVVSNPIATFENLFSQDTSLPPQDFTFGNAITGKLTSEQAQAIKTQTATSVFNTKKAGGASDAEAQAAAQAAADEVGSFIKNNEGGTSQDAIDNALPDAAAALNPFNLPTWAFLLIGFVAIVLVVIVVKEVL